MKKFVLLACFTWFLLPVAHAQLLQVTVANGMLAGVDESGVASFKGVPFAAPPVGSLRWKEPQPVADWKGVRKADKFGPRPMQLPLFGDMKFRSDSMSEDCLYLNVWTPAKSDKERLPVMVYFYGGGFMAGDASEFRYDGESMSRKGIVVITVNYRLNIFGFFNHPELTKESPHHASGNYGLLDQVAALHWVQKNIAAFGGDPGRVTIAGESAGSFSVSLQMASPLSKDLIAGAIGESGACMGKNAVTPLSVADLQGYSFADSIGVESLAALRAMPADVLLNATATSWFKKFPVTLDDYFLPASPEQLFTAGEQASVPLLAGWNSAEVDYKFLMGDEIPNKENYIKVVKKLFGNKAAPILKYYTAETDSDVEAVASQLACDRFIDFDTWKWTDLHAKSSGKPIYRYLYCHPRPVKRTETGNIRALVHNAAGHSWEIEYALGNLSTNRVYDWQFDDYKVSGIMQELFANFIKTGNPNGIGVPEWPAVKSNTEAPVLNIDINTKVLPEENRERYLFIYKYLLM